MPHPKPTCFSQSGVDLGDAVGVCVDQDVALHSGEHLLFAGGRVVFGIGPKFQAHQSQHRDCPRRLSPGAVPSRS